jgi:hypothetical protein
VEAVVRSAAPAVPQDSGLVKKQKGGEGTIVGFSPSRGCRPNDKPWYDLSVYRFDVVDLLFVLGFAVALTLLRSRMQVR